MRLSCILLCAAGLGAGALPATALDRPWISDTFFYWYTWDYDARWGDWGGQGVYFTPLVGHYDSLSYDDNLRELWMAAEWGMTHHFIDYWGTTWRDHEGKPRELNIIRAAEALRARGYDVNIGLYQDGSDFDMADFARNLDDGRDVDYMLKTFAPSTAWVTHKGRPFDIVYGRNGAPKVTADDAGFRGFLQERYGSIDALNEAWGTALGSFDEARFDLGYGVPRADAIDYQYALWQRGVDALSERAQTKYGYPGVGLSFDVAYAPYMGLSYTDFARVFGGPSSYGGIFAAPESQDTDRYIQAQVGRRADTIFFDHFKNHYFDHEIRIPGTAYHWEPYHFDRFWVGALMRRAEALLHLSWNEWWEGSPLEPSVELGKRFCEENLLYSTLMQECFGSIASTGKDAEVALILNEWALKVGAREFEEARETIARLRRIGVPFDLVPVSEVTADELSRFRVIVAPGCRVGFGQNAQGEAVASLLADWARAEAERRLIVSAAEDVRQALGIAVAAKEERPAATGPDLNVFVDVGAPGDERFLASGFSLAETMGQVTEGSSAAEAASVTRRWIPAVGKVTRLLMPCSPGREQVLRIAGSALWPNEVTVQVDGRPVGSFAIGPELPSPYELAIPGDAFHAGLCEIALVFRDANVPNDMDPARYPGEARVCNLYTQWVQLSTPNFTAGDTRPVFTTPASAVRPRGALAQVLDGRQEVPFAVREAIVPEGEVLSSYVDGDVPRDVVLSTGRGAALYVNGSLADIADEAYTSFALREFAGVTTPRIATAPDVTGDLLTLDGNTRIALAYNYAPGESRSVRFTVPTATPVAEVYALSHDGRRFEAIDFECTGGLVRFSDDIRFYGAYAVVGGPVRVSLPGLEVTQGRKVTGQARLRNLTDQTVRGTLRAAAVIPSIGGPESAFSLAPGASAVVPLAIETRDDVDWGRKTIVVRLASDHGDAAFLRELKVRPRPRVRIAPEVVRASGEAATVENVDNTYLASETLRDVTLSCAAWREPIAVGDLECGKPVAVALPAVEGLASLGDLPVTVRYEVGGEPVEEPVPLHVAPDRSAVSDALPTLVLANPTDVDLRGACLMAPLRGLPHDITVLDESGRPLPSQVVQGEDGYALAAIADVPAGTSRALTCVPASEAATGPELSLDTSALGTGHGTVTVRTSHYSVTLDEARGGTVTSMVSPHGADYGAESFGVSHGTFFDQPMDTPADGARNIVNALTCQRDGQGILRILEDGPVVKRVLAQWSDGAVEARQTYTFAADQPWFDVTSRLRFDGTRSDKEVCVLDARFSRNEHTKIAPNWTGWDLGAVLPHFGWRQVPRTPPVVSFLNTTTFADSVSLLVLSHRNLSEYRHGVWPHHRPEPGRSRYCEAEFLAAPEDAREGAEISVRVLFHEGNQGVAEDAWAGLPRVRALLCEQ